MARSIAAFPLVGLLQGAMLAGAAYITGLYLPGSVSSVLILLVLVVSSGGFHLDGLSDAFDAIAKRGARGEKLRVMKDGSAGAIGVAAVFLALLLKYLCIESLRASSHAGGGMFYYSLFLMPVLSKWAMVVSMFHGKAARAEGLGRLFVEGATAMRFVVSSLAALLIVLFFSHFLIRDAGATGPFFPELAMAVLYVTGVISAWFSGRQFGGHTGDTLGATGELSEIVFLLTAIIWSGNSF